MAANSADLVAGTAAWTAREYPPVRHQDITRELEQWLERDGTLLDGEDESLWRVKLREVAVDYARQERARVLQDTDQYYYRPADVKKLLPVFFDLRDWEAAEIPEDARRVYAAVRPPGSVDDVPYGGRNYAIHGSPEFAPPAVSVSTVRTVGLTQAQDAHALWVYDSSNPITIMSDLSYGWDKLTHQCKEVLMMRYLARWEYWEIGDALDMTPSGAANRVSRALRALLAHLNSGDK